MTGSDPTLHTSIYKSNMIRQHIHQNIVKSIVVATPSKINVYS